MYLQDNENLQVLKTKSVTLELLFHFFSVKFPSDKESCVCNSDAQWARSYGSDSSKHSKIFRGTFDCMRREFPLKNTGVILNFIYL